jgi:hypothetical protein
VKAEEKLAYSIPSFLSSSPMMNGFLLAAAKLVFDPLDFFDPTPFHRLTELFSLAIHNHFSSIPTIELTPI